MADTRVVYAGEFVSVNIKYRLLQKCLWITQSEKIALLLNLKLVVPLCCLL